MTTEEDDGSTPCGTNKEEEEKEIKSCSACTKDLTKESFSKKQWQAKKQRRCKDCVESNNEIVLTNGVNNLKITKEQTSEESEGAKASSKKKKGTTSSKKKQKPVYAGSQKGRYGPSNNGQGSRDFITKLSYEHCGWCGKVEEQGGEKLMKCSGCSNILYCSKTCQKLSFPEHQLVCEKLKEDYKASKKERKATKAKGLANKSFAYSEASGSGTIGFNCNALKDGNLFMVIYNGELRGDEEPGHYVATPQAEEGLKHKLGISAYNKFLQQLQMQSLSMQSSTEVYERIEYFSDVTELNPIDQFLLSCGALNNISQAKKALPYVLYLISISGYKPDGTLPDIGDITVRGYGLNALEWASRRGNHAIAEWLATDPRTKVLLTRKDSAPVAWACYTGKIELARMLVEHGADSKATAEKVFYFKPPTHLAAENGQLLAVRYLVEECGHDIHTCDKLDNDIRATLRVNNKAWMNIPGCVAVDEYAKSKGVEGYIKNRKIKFTREQITQLL